LAEALGVACHAVRADYTRHREPGDLALRAFGVDNHPDYPFRVELRGLPLEFRHEAGELWTRIRTGAGELVTHLRQTPEMTRAGISLPFVEE
jgi:hypothetical protein